MSLSVIYRLFLFQHHAHSEEHKGEHNRPSSNESAQSYEGLAALDGLLEISPDLLSQPGESAVPKKKNKKKSRRNKVFETQGYYPELNSIHTSM